MCQECYKKSEKSVFAENLHLVRRNAKLCEEVKRLQSEIKLLSRRNMDLERENFRLQQSLLDNEENYDER